MSVPMAKMSVASTRVPTILRRISSSCCIKMSSSAVLYDGGLELGSKVMSAGMECLEMKHDSGPISVKIPTLLTWVTIPSRTSPLNGRKTMALYQMLYVTNPDPDWMIPSPILSIVVTAITKPYFPVHVPSTSWNSFCLTVSINCGPKYRGWSWISCSNGMW